MPTDYPSERLQAIACAGFVQLVCVDGSSALPSWLRSTAVVAKVDELQRMGAMIAPPKANNDAGVGGVILPTSGSTGTPKLVQRSQASFSHRVEWTHEKHPFTKQDVCIQARVQTATHCQYELLEPLLAGVPVHVIPDVQQLGLDNFWATLTRLQVTRMNTLPTLLQATLTAGVSLPPTLTIIELVSEPVPRKLCRELQRQLPSCHLWALYGTTEASMSLAVDISAELQQSKTPDASLPPLLGVPTSPDVGVWLLDEQLRPVPGGEVGGLFLSGPQLFDCYVGMKELTREKLVDAELEVAGRPRRLRVYGTGDLAVRSADGSLILKGRSDRQVKVRGNTVHLGDIDAHLLQSRDVTQAVSVLSGDRVVSFITPKSVDESALRSELSQRMPAYMMPATVVKLAEFHSYPMGRSISSGLVPCGKAAGLVGTARRLALAHRARSWGRAAAAGLRDDEPPLRPLDVLCHSAPRGVGEPLAAGVRRRLDCSFSSARFQSPSPCKHLPSSRGCRTAVTRRRQCAARCANWHSTCCWASCPIYFGGW